MCLWNLLSTSKLHGYPHGMKSALLHASRPMAQSPQMKKILIVYHDAGGGHRNAAVALQTFLAGQPRDWRVELLQFQDVTDRLDVLRKVTGIRIQQQYNILLQNGWTLGSTYLLRVLQGTIQLFHKRLVNLLEKYWRENPVNLMVSVFPQFNRKIFENLYRLISWSPFCTVYTC